MQDTHFDTLIIGAGLSGIGTACRLTSEFPQRSLAILERRNTTGGTWDLFRYPGIRSDSDVSSYGYEFRPWEQPETFADGAAIRDYIDATADAYGIREKIRFGVTVVASDWSSEHKKWTVRAKDNDSGDQLEFTCRFLIACSGYYNYEQGYLPDFPGVSEYQGRLIHPQHWPQGLEYAGKHVLVIGSGATAVTLVPAMTDEAAHVTLLQRSPSYIYSVPGHDGLAMFLRRILPGKWVFHLIRKRNILIQRILVATARRWPAFTRRLLLSQVKKYLGPDVDMRHFTPKYMPWDERLCVVPDANLFHNVRKGKATIVTDHIETFTAGGILLKSGKELKADIVIAATGFNLQVLGGTTITVDGEEKLLGSLMAYKGALIQDIPNFAAVFGYVNLPWTIKVDLTASYLCRLFRYMDANNHSVVIAQDNGNRALSTSVMSKLNAGYVKRGDDCLPRQGSEAPWEVAHDYRRDRRALLKEQIDDGVLRFR